MNFNTFTLDPCPIYLPVPLALTEMLWRPTVVMAHYISANRIHSVPDHLLPFLINSCCGVNQSGCRWCLCWWCSGLCVIQNFTVWANKMQFRGQRCEIVHCQNIGVVFLNPIQQPLFWKKTQKDYKLQKFHIYNLIYLILILRLRRLWKTSYKNKYASFVTTNYYSPSGTIMLL